MEKLSATLVTNDEFDDAFKNMLIIKWLLSIVAAAIKPDGFHSRGVLTLQGAQNIGKTSWIRLLLPEGMLRDKYILTGHHLDPSNKDSLTTAIKHLIVEIGELDSSFRKDIARLKGFLTQDKDSVRRPYARSNSEYPRKTVFCASVNEQNFLVDQTGNSRFWTIPVTDIDYKHSIDMQQVYAQLYEMYKQGKTWWLTQEEEVQLSKYNRFHQAVSVIEEKVMSIMRDYSGEVDLIYKKPIEILEAVGMKFPTNRQCQECAAVLRREYGEPKKVQGHYRYKVPLDKYLIKNS